MSLCDVPVSRADLTSLMELIERWPKRERERLHCSNERRRRAQTSSLISKAIVVRVVVGVERTILATIPLTCGAVVASVVLEI